MNLTERSEWQALSDHQIAIGQKHMRDWFNEDRERYKRFSLSCAGLFLDYSRNRIDDLTIQLLCKLAHAVGLPQKIDALFSGQPINATEKRPALHTALRDPTDQPILVNGKNIKPEIKAVRERLRALVSRIHHEDWRGVTGKPIRHIVNVGIGGSHLGPMMTTIALKDFAVKDLQFYFISTVDKAVLLEVIDQIDPETTLFIISSKTFSTIETLTNANTLVAWMKEKLGPEVLKHHFIAVTKAAEKAETFGIPAEHIFPMWDWVGGRYSVWSAIGLPLMLMLGTQQFDDFLAGAYEMDQHFKNARFEKNMPVILAMLGIWYMNFFKTNVQAIIPYSHKLRYLISYLQQAEMESNGKSIRLSGLPTSYGTGAVIFGEEGCNGQHAYHQLLLQGRHLIPVDFILIGSKENDTHHDILLASGLSQAQALMRGKTYEESLQELLAAAYSQKDAEVLAPHRVIPGNRPNNILLLDELSPNRLGALLALYEHKIFVQGVIWDINSFDQWGVELGKQLLPAILQSVQNPMEHTDAATRNLIQQIKKLQSPT